MKRTTIYFKILLFCLLVTQNNLLSQSTDTVGVTLPILLKQALESNYNAKKAKLDVQNTENKINEVRSAAMPQIAGAAGINYNPLLQKSALPGDFFGRPGTTVLLALGQEWNANAGVSLNQIIFNQSVFTGLKAAKTTREFYQVNSELTEENIIEQVATAYFGLLVQQHAVVALDSTINNMRELNKIMESQLKNGLVKKVDVNRISVSLVNLEGRRQQLQNAIAILEYQLKFLSGIAVDSKISFAVFDIKAIPTNPPPTVFPGIANRPTIKLLNAREKLLHFQSKTFESEYYPSLVFLGNYSYQGLGNEFLFTAPKGKVNWFSVATIGLSLRVPLFNGFATNSRIQQSRIEMLKLREDRNMAEQALSLEFANAVTQMNNNVLTLNTQKRNIELADEVHRSTIDNYRNGLATMSDLLSAENGLTEAQANYLTALLNYKLSEVQLLKAQGELKKLRN